MNEIELNKFFTAECKNKKDFGTTYKVNPMYGKGYQWTCNIGNNFSISIHDIKFNSEVMLKYTLTDRYVLVLYISGSGDEFYPYQNISPNTLRCYEPKENYKVIYHPQIELKSISIEFTAEFIDKYLEEKYSDIDITFSDFFKNKGKLFLPKLNKLMFEIYKYNEAYSIAKLFLESKVYESLSLISFYLEQGEQNLIQSNPISEKDIQSLQEIAKYMDEHYNFNISLQTLSKIACMNESKMKKSFKSYYNMSITEYIQRKRISIAEHLLISTTLSVNEISKIVGYSNPSRLTELFKRYYGFMPSNYR